MSMIRLIRAKAEKRASIDILCLIWWLASFLAFGYLVTYVESIALKAMIGFVLMLAGLVAMVFWVGVDTQQFLSLGILKDNFGLVIAGLAAVFVVNAASSSIKLASVPVTGAVFAMLMAVAEETLFRGFLLTLIVRLTGNETVAVLLSSLVGTVYHSAVYGTSATLIFVVFGCFAVLGVVYIASGYKLSVTMTTHALVNLISFIR